MGKRLKEEGKSGKLGDGRTEDGDRKEKKKVRRLRRLTEDERRKDVAMERRIDVKIVLRIEYRVLRKI